MYYIGSISLYELFTRILNAHSLLGDDVQAYSSRLISEIES